MAVPPVQNNPPATPTVDERIHRDVIDDGAPLARGIGHVTAKVARVAGDHLGGIAQETTVLVGGGGSGAMVGGVMGGALGAAAGVGVAATMASVAPPVVVALGTALGTATIGTAATIVSAPVIIPTLAIFGGIGGAFYVGEKSIEWARHFLAHPNQ